MRLLRWDLEPDFETTDALVLGNLGPQWALCDGHPYHGLQDVALEGPEDHDPWRFPIYRFVAQEHHGAHGLLARSRKPAIMPCLKVGHPEQSAAEGSVHCIDAPLETLTLTDVTKPFEDLLHGAR